MQQRAGVAKRLGFSRPLADALGAVRAVNESTQVGTTSLPLAVGLILMMYQPLAKASGSASGTRYGPADPPRRHLRDGAAVGPHPLTRAAAAADLPAARSPSTEVPLPLTYASYLRLPELLELQTPVSSPAEHDETLFIVVHQVYELWFKQILHELDRLQALLEAGDDVRVRHTLKRVLTILKVLVAQLDILETMTPLEFLTFRDRLETGSGFQSHQFRALEFALGQKRPQAVQHYEAGSAARAWLEARFDRPGIWDSFLHWLARQGHPVPPADLERDVRRPVEASPALQRVLLDVYRNDPNARDLCERFVDLDEGVQEWRYRHVKMVERTIGARPGTGGSAGAEYLRMTLRPAFPDLWEIRSEL